ncbi:transporter [Escherichia coli]|nr:transporter [Escherichia coli]EFN9305891.1 transporter [Escherichia coli]MHP51479.1 transporter [Escherichia coli]
MSFHPCDSPVSWDVFVPATVLLFPAALITVCFVVLLPVPFLGVPLAGRAVVNGASEAVSALAGFHP